MDNYITRFLEIQLTNKETRNYYDYLCKGKVMETRICEADISLLVWCYMT